MIFWLQPFVGSEIVFHFLSLLCRTVAYIQDSNSIKTRFALEYMENEFATLNGINALADKLSSAVIFTTISVSFSNAICPKVPVCNPLSIGSDSYERLGIPISVQFLRFSLLGT